MDKTAAAMTTSLGEKGFLDGDWGRVREEMLAGNVLTTLGNAAAVVPFGDGGGGGFGGESEGKKGLLPLPLPLPEEGTLEEGSLGCWG